MAQYLAQAPKPTADQLAEIERLEKHAQDALDRREESFARCDTDGFLSQWAHGMTAEKNHATIAILKNGGYARFPVLCDEDGNVVADKVYRFPDRFKGYGTVKRWRLPDELAGKAGRKWIPVAGYSGKSRVQKTLGLHEEDRWFPAVAKITTGGRKSTGLSGCANAFVATFKVGEEEE